MFSITGLIIAYLICHSAHGLPDPQIVGGTTAPDGQYPYQVSLKTTDKSHFCGGAIVSKRYIITAAHCLETLFYPTNVLVDVGNNYLYSQTTYTAEEIIIHPNYNKTLFLNDIGLIRLSKDLTFDKNVASIPLISYDDDFDGVDFIVTGWGRLWSNGLSPDRLQQITVKGFSQKTCAQTYKNNPPIINSSHVCTLQAWGQGMCNGDSGGALTLKGELVGIVSFGKQPCASGWPDVFTRVFHYKTWVNDYINAGSNQHLNILLGLITSYLCIHSFL